MGLWDIEIGETLPRKDLHDRWGGGRFGGMEPSVKANSVFLFTNPDKGVAFGYDFDGWHSDGALHYTGDGQVGDQSPDDGGNRALLRAAEQGRAIRMFRSRGKDTTYVGEFALRDDPAYYRADSLDRNGETRSVLVFRLQPEGYVADAQLNTAEEDTGTPESLPVEASNVDAYARHRPDEPAEAVRREALLVQRYVAWLDDQGQASCRHRVPLPDGGYLFTDLFNRVKGELIEAKASSARTYVRAGLGQVLDYARFLSHDSLAVLTPTRPSDDLIELLNTYGVAAVWEDGLSFLRTDP